MRKIGKKYHIEGGEIIKTATGQGIPEDEPTFLFRGCDRLALRALKWYLGLCIEDGCTQGQIEEVRQIVQEFEDFAYSSPTMKQPGCTMGR